MPDEGGESEHRRDERRNVGVEGRYRTGNGVPRDVWITDISRTGCRFYDRFGNLPPGTSISIRIAGIGPIDATVRWLEQHVNGIEFVNPLYDAVYDHICANLSEKPGDA